MQQNNDQYEKMINTPIPKLILTLAVPTIIGMLITSAYNMADAYFVSKLGTSASGAIGIGFFPDGDHTGTRFYRRYGEWKYDLKASWKKRK